MAEKKKQTIQVHGVGFIACYKGKEIAFSRSFKDLANTAKVKTLLGDKDLVIKHNVPENIVAIY
ncbi:MAG: hypothetical protein HYX80_04705 [Chloroflexi bacterium]|nr:hypothetical protein [Chloroflexota bacterium]